MYFKINFDKQVLLEFARWEKRKKNLESEGKTCIRKVREAYGSKKMEDKSRR